MRKVLGHGHWGARQSSSPTLLPRVFQLNKSTFTKIEENTEKKGASEKSKATIIFSLKNEVGGLVKALRLFQVRTRVVKLTLYDKSMWPLAHYSDLQ